MNVATTSCHSNGVRVGSKPNGQTAVGGADREVKRGAIRSSREWGIRVVGEEVDMLQLFRAYAERIRENDFDFSMMTTSERLFSLSRRCVSS